MRLKDCFNFHDFRELARRRLPGPIFNYIDGAADDETTYRRNTAAFEECDLLPNVLRGVEHVDLSVIVMGQKLQVPFYCSPTALQRLFHHEGERAVAHAVQKFGTMFGLSSLGTVSLEDLSSNFSFPQVYQFYFHKDRGLNKAMLDRAKAAGVHILMLTVDSITGGNRERDLRTGFSIPFSLTLEGMAQFALKPKWAIEYAVHEKFRLPQLEQHVAMSGGTTSIGDYFTNMLDPSMNWRDVAEMVKHWDDKFCLKGIMSSRRRKKSRRHWLRRNRRFESRWASTRRLTQFVRPACRNCRRRRRQDRCSARRRSSARDPCAEGTLGGRQSGRTGPVLSFSIGRSGTAWR